MQAAGAAIVFCASALVACAGPATAPGQMDLTAARRTAAGGETRVTATLRNATPEHGRRFDGADPGIVSVRFRGQDTGSPWPGVGLGRPWTGVVESDPIDMPRACEIASASGL